MEEESASPKGSRDLPRGADSGPHVGSPIPPHRTLTLQALVHFFLVRPLLKLLFGVGVEGKENLAGLEQFILVANHNSHLDTLFLFQILPPHLVTTTHPVAALDYFSKNRVLFAVARFLFRPVWITRGDREGDSLEGMRERLRAGRSIILFPEGTRGEPGEMARFRKGIGRLAVEFPGVPIVPAYLAGAEKALPKSSSVPLPVWTRVVVGLPQRFRGTAGEITAALEGLVRELEALETGRRHRRLRRPSSIPTVAVLGIDGSGKSTLSRELARLLSTSGRVCLVSDVVEFFEGGEPSRVQPLVTEALRQVIGRRAKTARSLKSYKIPKLAELLLRDHVLEEMKRWYAPDLVVSDGCPLLNMTAWARLYRDEEPDDGLLASAMGILSGREKGSRGDRVFKEFPELMALERLPIPHLHCPEAVLFLDVDPAVSVERIGARGETMQVHETREKLARLRDGYRSVCRVLERDWRIPVRTLDGHRPMDEVTRAALRAFREMGVVEKSGQRKPNDDGVGTAGGGRPSLPGAIPEPPGTMPEPPGTMPEPPGTMPEPPGTTPEPPPDGEPAGGRKPHA